MAVVYPNGNIKSIAIKTKEKGFVTPKDVYIKVNGVWKKVVKSYRKTRCSSSETSKWVEVPSMLPLINGIILSSDESVTFYDYSLNDITPNKDNFSNLYHMVADMTENFISKDGILVRAKHPTNSSYKIMFLDNHGNIVWNLGSLIDWPYLYCSSKGHAYIIRYGYEKSPIIDLKNGNTIGTFDVRKSINRFITYKIGFDGNLLAFTNDITNSPYNLSISRIDKNGKIINKYNISTDFFPRVAYVLHEDSSYLYCVAVGGGSNSNDTLFKINKENLKIENKVDFISRSPLDSYYSPYVTLSNVKGGFMYAVNKEKREFGNDRAGIYYLDRNFNKVSYNSTPPYKDVFVNNFSSATKNKGEVYFPAGGTNGRMYLGITNVNLKDINLHDIKYSSSLKSFNVCGDFTENISCYE